MIVKKVRKIRLAILTHLTTGLKYLCVTTREPFRTYTGSGTAWKAHTKEHGRGIDDMHRQILYEEEISKGELPSEKFQKTCVEMSQKYDIVEDKNFANAQIETGITGIKGRFGFKVQDVRIRKLYEYDVEEEIKELEYNKKIEIVGYDEFPAETDIESESIKSDKFSHLYSLISKLSPRFQKVIKLYYGIGVNKEYTPKEISYQLDVSVGTVKIYIQNAIEQLRRFSSYEGTMYDKKGDEVWYAKDSTKKELVEKENEKQKQYCGYGVNNTTYWFQYP
tara:strand:- start:23 stop:856 length:834 start_codon:yes stop_codon:yes gene_type:complete